MDPNTPANAEHDGSLDDDALDQVAGGFGEGINLGPGGTNPL
jgi:hypothetical protein